MIGFKGIGRLVTDRELLGYVLLVENGIIRYILPEEESEEWLRLNGATVEYWVDIQGLDLMPGFIDIHVHGSSGADASDGTPESIGTIADSLIRTGVTGFLATTVTMDDTSVRRVLSASRQVMENQGLESARLLGVHLEGPFLSVSHKGAHEESLIVDPLLEHIESIGEGYWDIIRVITLAPERPGALESIKSLAERGVVVSLGHSGCTFDQGKEAIAAGAKSITHLFNAMTGLHHRDPGLVGVALTTDVHTELVADGIHVHPELFSVVRKVKGDERLILITDAMRGQCMRAGTYNLGGLEVIVDGTGARLKNGVLAGSVLTMDQAMRNMHDHADCDLAALARMLSTNPAELLGLDDVGAISVGKRADLVAVDGELNVKRVWLGGVEKEII